MKIESYLQVSELGELLSAIVKAAEVRFGMIVDDFVSPYVSTLGEAFAALLALIGSFASVSSFVGLSVHVSDKMRSVKAASYVL
jgi:hypothetical protein